MKLNYYFIKKIHIKKTIRQFYLNVLFIYYFATFRVEYPVQL